MADTRMSERKFYTAMALLALVAVFLGFGRTYFFREWSELPPLPALVHVHGAVFTAWVLMFLTQARLVSARRTDLHRRLGVVGGVLAVAMIVLGVATAIAAARRGSSLVTTDPLSFLIIPLGDIVIFAVLVGGAFRNRRRPDVHKRLMLLATFGALMPAAIGRVPFVAGHIPIVVGIYGLMLAAGPIFDWRAHGRVHPVFKWGAPLVFLTTPARLALGETSLWRGFAAWLVG